MVILVVVVAYITKLRTNNHIENAALQIVIAMILEADRDITQSHSHLQQEWPAPTHTGGQVGSGSCDKKIKKNLDPQIP